MSEHAIYLCKSARRPRHGKEILNLLAADLCSRIGVEIPYLFGATDDGGALTGERRQAQNHVRRSGSGSIAKMDDQLCR